MQEFIPGAAVLCRAQHQQPPPHHPLETCLIKNTILLITLLPANEPDPSLPWQHPKHASSALGFEMHREAPQPLQHPEMSTGVLGT